MRECACKSLGLRGVTSVLTIRNRQVIGSSPIVGSIYQRLRGRPKLFGAHLGPKAIRALFRAAGLS